jgi:hypothetical protein
MGYSLRVHLWTHRERKAIFVGDYIDRGPADLETLYMVKKMVDAGAAYAIMGNHEYNALAFESIILLGDIPVNILLKPSSTL